MIANKDGGVSARGTGRFASRLAAATVPSRHDRLAEAMEATSRWLLDRQHGEGYWVGELEGDTILESEYVLLMAYLGRLDDPVCVKACRYIREKQLPGGGWAIYPGGPCELSATVKAYFALKLLGVSPDDPAMAGARAAILERGGAQASNSFTRFYLALLGQIDYDDCPSVPPELVLLPSRLNFSLAAMSSWTRTIVVPLSIISAFKPVRRLAPEQGVAELFRTDLPRRLSRRTPELVSWANVFLAIDRLLKWADRWLPRSWRRPGIKAAHRWILEHCENTDGLGAIFPPMISTVIAFECLGYERDSALVQWALRQLDALMIEERGTVRLQPCLSPVWDTAITTIALADADVPGYHPALLDSVRWLLEMEVQRAGDWQVRRPGIEPTGWHFQFQNERYPDLDDTAMVLLALQRTAMVHAPEVEAATRRGVNWLLAMQNRDGGWAAYDVDIDNEVLTKVPFADHNAMLDPSCADITARVLELLGTLGYRADHPAVARALAYLWRTQEPQGCWYGRWGVNYIYGTWQVLQGLKALDFPMEHPAPVRAADWLESVQQADDGWGETCRSYDDPSLMGRGTPTASQTAWALLGLIAAGRAEGEAVLRGIDHLLASRRPDGTWDEDCYTGTGFPRVFYL
ncbi:MAG: squalene-hopene/tetraprenyl-beta-curcumene cyclase, partial [Chloroflexota bacterium]|nr:squalene-hopene/tetraprenyl-beta-curcumene cyclase [Chloroflexota bacterium]